MASDCLKWHADRKHIANVFQNRTIKDPHLLDEKMLPVLTVWLKGFIDWLRGLAIMATAQM